MNKSLALLALSALLLTGCSVAAQSTASATGVATESTSPSSPASSASPTPAMATKQATRDEQITAIYLEGVRKDQAGLKAAADADPVTIGQGFCKMYDGGAKGSDINQYVLKAAAGVDYTVPLPVSIHGSAVGAFCPRYIDKMGS